MNLVRKGTLDDWQMHFYGIYGKRNSRRGIETLLLELMTRLGTTAETVRKSVVDIPRALASCGAHIFAIAGKMHDVSLGEQLALKYPSLCIYCRSCPCSCLEVGLDSQNRSKLSVEEPDSDLVFLPFLDWQQLLHSLYGPANAQAGRTEVFLHLIEEMGEVSDALMRGDEAHAAEELADVFAWWLGYVSLMQAELPRIFSNSAPELLWNHYPQKCLHCNNNLCSCSFL